MLEIAAQSVRFFPAEFRRDGATSDKDAKAETAIGGKFWDGVTHICKSPLPVWTVPFHHALHTHVDVGLFPTG